MSTLRTTTLKHGGSTVLDNLVLSNAGETRFCPNSSFGVAALYVDGQTNRVGVNTETPGVALDVDGAVNATGNVAIGGTLDITGLLTSNGNLLVNGTLNVTGTGTFGNNVSSVGYFGAGGNPSGGVADGTRIYAGGGCTASTGTGTSALWRGYTTNNGSTTSSILANGESTFQGDMTISRADPGNDVFLRIKNSTLTDAGTTCSLRLSTSSGAFDTSVFQADRVTGSTFFFYGTTKNLELTRLGALKTGAGLYDSDASDGGIDAGSGLYSILFGGNSGGGSNQNQARIDNGNKEGRIVLCHKTNAEEPIGVITGFSQGTNNQVYIGGGSALVNAATEISLYTAANNTTTGGTKQVTIDESGRFIMSRSAPSDYIRLGNTNRFDNGESALLAFYHGYNTPREVASIYTTTTSNSPSLWGAGSLRFRTGTSGNNDAGNNIADRVVIDYLGRVTVSETLNGIKIGATTAAGGGLNLIRLAVGSGTSAVDTGISINQGNSGGTMLIFANKNTSGGTATNSAIYAAQFYYSGDNAPTISLISTTSAVLDDFVTFGVSASNTMTMTFGNANWGAWGIFLT